MKDFSLKQKRLRVVYHDLRAEINPMLSADLGRLRLHLT